MTAVAKTNKTQLQIANANLANPSGMLELAETVKTFILDQRLYTAIQGRNYVNVEGWQFAGGMIGVLPIAQGTENLSAGDELKYKASVHLLNIHTQQIVGSGFATCSNKEKGKKFFDEYAIESMAQTRAVGKAYRLMLGWLIKAAGYESTPAEEMDFQNAEVVDTKTQEQPKKQPESTTQSEEKPVGEYATAKQKEEIIHLLNDDCITKQEKTKMLLNLGKLDRARADQAITKLKATIEERTGKPFVKKEKPADKATEKQKDLIQSLAKSHVITEEEWEEISLQCASDHFTVAEAADLITQLQQTVNDRKKAEKAAA